jgi:biofilm PGA synthesis N-glycosyltransferase PgaC
MKSLATSTSEKDSSAAELALGLITPARNEATFIEATIQTVVAQTVRPARWIIVSDGSTDGTDEIVKAYAARHDWIELLRMPERRERHFGGKARAFNSGWDRLRGPDYDVIGNLDADITLDKDHFAVLLRKFRDNPRLGVAGAPFRDGNQQYDYRFTSIEHVSGACQLFRRECFEEVGGYQPIEIGGVDLIAVITARMKGWETRTFPEKICTHHRQMGSAQRGTLEIAFMGGVSDYRLGMHPLWEAFRTPYQMTKQPLVIRGALRFLGFVWAMAGRKKKVIPQDVEKFRRAEQMIRMRAKVMGIVPSLGAVPAKTSEPRT